MYRYVCVDAYSNIYMYRSMHTYIHPYVIIIMKKEAMNLRIVRRSKWKCLKGGMKLCNDIILSKKEF